MKKRMMVSLLLVLILVFTTFSAVLAQTHAPVTINMMVRGFLTKEAKFEESLARFKTDYPYVEVVTNIVDNDAAFVIAYSADNSPDIWMVGDFSIRGDINNGRLYPLDEYLSDAQKDDMFELYRNRVSHEGKIYAWMANTDARIIYYNKDIFEAAGLDREYHPTTWSEWLTVMEKTNHVMGEDQYAYAFPAGVEMNTVLMWDTLVHQCGGVTVDDASGKITIDSAPAIKAAEFYQSLVAKQYVSQSAFGQDEVLRKKQFALGNLAMMMGGSWEKAQLRADSEMDVDNTVGWFPIPYPDEGQPATIGGFWNLAVSSKSKNPDEAAALISYLYSDEYLQHNVAETNAVPTRKSHMLLPEVQNDAFNKGVSEYVALCGYPEISSEYFAEISEPLVRALIDIWQNGADAKTTLTNVANELNTELGL